MDTLDIAFQNFSLVGGEEGFLAECGAGRTDSDRGLLQLGKIVNVCKNIVITYIILLFLTNTTM